MRRITAALATATAMVVVPLGAAHAGEYVDVDASGDVHSISGEEDTFVPAPTVANGDVTRTRVSHTNRDVAIRIKFRELSRLGRMHIDFIRLVTDEGVRREVSVWAGPNRWRGRHEMTTLNGDAVRCGVTHFIDYDSNVVFVRVPRSCLSSPRWVRVALGTIWMRGDGFYADDAFLDDAIRDRGPILSRRVWRG